MNMFPSYPPREHTQPAAPQRGTRHLDVRTPSSSEPEPIEGSRASLLGPIPKTSIRGKVSPQSCDSPLTNPITHMRFRNQSHRKTILGFLEGFVAGIPGDGQCVAQSRSVMRYMMCERTNPPVKMGFIGETVQGQASDLVRTQSSEAQSPGSFLPKLALGGSGPCNSRD